MNTNYPQIIRKEYKEKLIDKDLVRFGNKLIHNFFFHKKHFEAHKLSNVCYKILVNILQTLRNEQFMNNNPVQLSLFNEEFLTEHNTYAKIKIRNSKITRDTETLKIAYKELSLYMYDWYESTNTQGEKIQSLGGLISNVSHSERGYTSFLISSYWLQNLLDMSEGFNNSLYFLPYKTKSGKHMLFSLWLAHLKEDSGTITLKYFNKLFGTNYLTANEFGQKFLKPICEFLNKNGLQSMEFRVEENKIYYTRYELKTTQTEISKETQEKQTEIYQLSYYKKRHKLNEEQVERMQYFIRYGTKLEFFHSAYLLLKEECKKNKIKLTELIGDDFLNEFQKYIIEHYLTTRSSKHSPKGYPIINIPNGISQNEIKS